VSNLFPEIKPYRTEMLKVSDLHTLYVEESGNPNGKPVVFLHGGPGGGTAPICRQYFDPKFWRIIIFDQRGCGQSLPFAELKDNTTWDLVRDIETIRKHLKIERWLVFGGSWGSTLSLAYAETHPERVVGLVLRGIFMCRRWELEWFYQHGCSVMFPDLWKPYVDVIPEAERGDMMTAYYKRLTSSDPMVRLRAAEEWSGWEGATSRLLPDAQRTADSRKQHFAEALARIECHYFVNKCWFEHDDQLLRNAHKIAKTPGWIVHGRYDVVCPLQNAFDLKDAWPIGKLQVVEGAGHSMTEPGIASSLVDAVDEAKGLF